MSTIEHKKEAPRAVTCKVITVSDTRTKEDDKSGKLIIRLLEEAGHRIGDYVIVKDEMEELRKEILKGASDDDIDVIITNGGTGIAKRDITIETVRELVDKELPGFGELFRMLSYQEDIGPAAFLSRATAGVINNTVIFSTPGSSGAVKLAMNKLILPEITHAVREVRKDLR